MKAKSTKKPESKAQPATKTKPAAALRDLPPRKDTKGGRGLTEGKDK